VSYIDRRRKGTGSVRKYHGGYQAILSRDGNHAKPDVLPNPDGRSFFDTKHDAEVALDLFYKDKLVDDAQNVHGGEQVTLWLSPWLLDRMPKEDRSRWIREAMKEKIERQG
jgi:hypothetical protein